MPASSPLDLLRPRTWQALAVNAGLLEQAPSAPHPDDRQASGGNPAESLTTVPGGVAEGLWARVEHQMPRAASRGERAARGLTEVHLRGLGPVTDAIDYATAEDKGRALAGIAGGEIGSAIGAAIPGMEPITVPLGGVVGNWAGHELYDHRRDIRDGLAQGLADRIRPYMPPVTRDRF
jgi:hypothetical protein